MLSLFRSRQSVAAENLFGHSLPRRAIASATGYKLSAHVESSSHAESHSRVCACRTPVGLLSVVASTAHMPGARSEPASELVIELLLAQAGKITGPAQLLAVCEDIDDEITDACWPNTVSAVFVLHERDQAHVVIAGDCDGYVEDTHFQYLGAHQRSPALGHAQADLKVFTVPAQGRMIIGCNGLFQNVPIAYVMREAANVAEAPAKIAAKIRQVEKGLPADYSCLAFEAVPV